MGPKFVTRRFALRTTLKLIFVLLCLAYIGADGVVHAKSDYCTAHYYGDGPTGANAYQDCYNGGSSWCQQRCDEDCGPEYVYQNHTCSSAYYDYSEEMWVSWGTCDCYSS